MTRRWPGALAKGVFLLVVGAYFLIPLWSMLDYSTQVPGSDPGRTFEAWQSLVTDDTLFATIVTSLLLSVITVVLMVLLLLPTMIWVRLRVPWAERLIEFICLLPLAVPALVIVVGIKNVMLWVSLFVGDTPYALALPYVVLVLPYSYRAIDSALSSIDAETLAEAARSLGAGWGSVIVRVILPNIVAGIVSAAFISIALVLGEYTFASLLNYPTLPVQIVQISQSQAQTSVAASLASIVLISIMLLGLSFFSRDRATTPKGS